MQRVVALMLFAVPAMVAAQREPVLKQVDVPHPYYWRELYIPQVTSGPSAAAWSPDGRELVYSMQGSLWRQRVGTDSATQLTDGPGYDYQPDWSPDGRFVVYASYHDDAIELRMLELATRESRSLVGNGAVNVEPRWSPDGRRVAFVSTMFKKRFHLFVADVRDGRAGAARRVSDDRAGGLPRYYYSQWDHTISPAWSPDGRELVYVNNRGHVWGSGGIWRAVVPGPGATGLNGREIRDEETTWGARPDWSRDGRRIVYASYLGRQWHQLWLMTAEGKNPVQLTYGEWDATSPRWSPDASRIAFISNDGGNTSLRIVDVRGGRIERVVANRRRYRSSISRFEIISDEGARAVRASIRGADGRYWAPDNAWRHADDGFDRRLQRMETGYFHVDGLVSLTLPVGRYAYQAWRGFECRPQTETIDVEVGVVSGLGGAECARIADLAKDGWRSGDLHVHMNYGGHYRATPASLAFQARAEHLDVVEALIVNKEGRVPDLPYFTGAVDTVSGRGVTISFSQEFHTSFWGHTGLLGLRDHVLLPSYASYQVTPISSPVPTNADVADLGHAQGALFGYVHPLDEDPDPANAKVSLTNELPVDVALGKVDYMEILGFADHLATARTWYRLLNCGFKIPAGAGTDAMTNYASLRGPVGMNRVYVKTTGASHEAFLRGLKAGRTFATNGPLVTITVDGHEPGDEIALAPGTSTVSVKVWLRSIVGVEKLEVVSNGAVVASIPLAGDRTRADTTISLAMATSGWIAVRAWSSRADPLVFDNYPFATTSPVYVTVGGLPIRSSADAKWFLTWVARLHAAARAHSGYDAPAERAHVLAQIDSARVEFERRAAP